jgi:hypothetical protein
LGVLRTEVEDQDAVGMNVEGHDSSLVEFRNNAGLWITAPATNLRTAFGGKPECIPDQPTR